MVRAEEDHVDRLRAQWSEELPDLDTTAMSVLGRIYRLSNLVTPGIEATFARFGLDRGEFDVVATLRRAGPPYRLTPTELYAALMVPSGSLTHRLGRLEKAGLIVRRPSQADGRSIAVELSKEGRRRAEAAFRADMADERRLLGSMSREELTRLEALLRKLNLAVERELDVVRR